MLKTHTRRYCGVSLLLMGLGGCGSEQASISYVCEEPLDKYLELARTNIANDYAVERSSEVLAACPGKGFHRRYTFQFPKTAIVSKQSSEATVTAAWCNDDTVKSTEAELEVSVSTLTFHFNYPWSTATGKYPRTEFRLNRSSQRGGFFEDLNWTCTLQNES